MLISFHLPTRSTNPRRERWLRELLTPAAVAVSAAGMVLLLSSTITGRLAGPTAIVGGAPAATSWHAGHASSGGWAPPTGAAADVTPATMQVSLFGASHPEALHTTQVATPGGVLVAKLIDENGQSVATATLDATTPATFAGLAAGSYRLVLLGETPVTEHGNGVALSNATAQLVGPFSTATGDMIVVGTPASATR